MKTVYYPNMFGDVLLTGVLVHEDETYSYVIEPLGYDWLKAIEKLDWIPSIRHINLEKGIYNVIPASIGPSHQPEDRWIFDIPVESANVFHHYIHFFEHFLSKRDQSVYSAVKEIINMTRNSFPSAVLAHILESLAEQYPKELSLRTLMMHDGDKE